MSYFYKSLHRTVQVAPYRLLYITNRASSQNCSEGGRHEKQHKHHKKALVVGVGVAVTSWIAYTAYERCKNKVPLKAAADLSTCKNNVPLKAAADISTSQYGSYKAGLPLYSLDQVAENADREKKVWVTFKEGVYDITDYVSKHPGGEMIMLAAGSYVEPFWLLYGAHYGQEILQLLEGMRIGNLSPEDAKQATANMSDPYENEPMRHAALKPGTKRPFTGEVHPSLLVDSFLTPNDFFYVRNHLPVPDVDGRTYELNVEVEGQNEALVLSLDALKELPKYTITATLMCSGNRRSEMIAVKPVKALSWGPAAIGNATWTGARLSDVLKSVGITEDTKEFEHVQFEGLDTEPTNRPYTVSIPLWKAVDKRGDVLIAYEMNGQPLPRDHGYPVRVVIPGVAGARNVKWLDRIFVSKKESDSHWQQHDYKSFSPTVDWDTLDSSTSPAVQDLPVTSAICKPSNGQTVDVVDGHIVVQGYAWSGGGHKIIRVDVTVDGGQTWQVAKFDQQDSSSSPHHWAWTLWSARIPVPKATKEIEIWAKAVDSSYNTQPETFKNIWNLRGVVGNAYHRIKVHIQ